MEQLPKGIYDICDLEIARCDLVKHRREQEKVIPANEANLYRAFSRQQFLEMNGGINPTETTAENDNSFFARLIRWLVDHRVLSILAVIAAQELRRGCLLACCVQQFCLRYSATAGLTKPFLYLISRRAEFFYRSTHPSGEFRQFFCAEQKQHDEQDYHHVRSHKIENTTDHWIHKSDISAQQVCFTHSYRLRRAIFPQNDFYLDCATIMIGPFSDSACRARKPIGRPFGSRTRSALRILADASSQSFSLSRCTTVILPV